MVDELKMVLLLDDQDPRMCTIPMNGPMSPRDIWGKRKYLVDALLRIITREEPYNQLRRKALATLAALEEWRREHPAFFVGRN